MAETGGDGYTRRLEGERRVWTANLWASRVMGGLALLATIRNALSEPTGDLGVSATVTAALFFVLAVSHFALAQIERDLTEARLKIYDAPPDLSPERARQILEEPTHRLRLHRDEKGIW